MASFQGLEYATPLTINSRGRVFRSETLNLKIQTNQNATQRWDLSITLEPTTDGATIAPLSVHRNINGLHTGFTMEMPQHSGVEDRLVDGTIQVAGPRVAGLSTALIDKPTGTGIDGFLPAGYFFKFSNHPKVYTVTEDRVVPSDGTIVALGFFPPLTNDLAANDTIDFEPMISVKYSPDGIEGVTYTDGELVNTIINVAEDLV